MTETLLTVENMSVGYGGRPVVSGISLAIARDSFVAVLGANGSGKSTLLKTLLRLIPPVSGALQIAQPDGCPIVFGYVPQFSQLDPLYLLTGFEVALMGCYGRIRPGRLIPADERGFTRECLAAVGAADFADRPFAELSGGQKQRVLIARALAARPDLLILDEPTSGVDHAATHEVMAFISRTCQERRIAVLLVTHDFGVVRSHARHVVWLHEGRVLQGSAADVLTAERLSEMLEMGVQ